MSRWESAGRSNEWYTPKYIFDALGCQFDLDVAHPAATEIITPSKTIISSQSLEKEWSGYVWMNPPFGGRNSLTPWIDKFFAHGNGIALTPDRTSAPWYKLCLRNCSSFLILSKKVKFIKPDGTVGASPGCGTTLWAAGSKATEALAMAHETGIGTYCEAKK